MVVCHLSLTPIPSSMVFLGEISIPIFLSKNVTNNIVNRGQNQFFFQSDCNSIREAEEEKICWHFVPHIQLVWTPKKKHLRRNPQDSLIVAPIGLKLSCLNFGLVYFLQLFVSSLSMAGQKADIKIGKQKTTVWITVSKKYEKLMQLTAHLNRC